MPGSDQLRVHNGIYLANRQLASFFDGETYWLAEDFHRMAAAKKARLDEVGVDVRQGGQRDVILFSVGSSPDISPRQVHRPQESEIILL